MKYTKELDWSQLGLGFWLGVALISLVNISLILVGHNQLLYDEYIFCVSLLISVIYLVARSRLK